MDSKHRVYPVDQIPNRWDDYINKKTINLDLTKKESLKQLPKDIDLIVHFAANARVHALVQRPLGAKENIDMTFNILEHARKTGSDIIFGSSREVYGNKGKTIYSEDDTLVDDCESPYTASKVSGESLVKSYENCYDMSSVILRFSNVYGRYDASDRVIPLFIARALNGRDLTVYGEDKILDFTYLDDCVSGVMSVVNNLEKIRGSTFNIASGSGTSLVELAESVVEIVDSDSNIHIEPSRTGEVTRFVADISKAEKLLDYSPSYTFSEGLESSVDWYTAHEDVLAEVMRD